MRRENPPGVAAGVPWLFPITREDVVFVVCTMYVMCGPMGVLLLVATGLLVQGVVSRANR